jgi:predicted nucleotide-binding protein
LERPFADDEKVPDLKKLKADLDTIIADTQQEIVRSTLIQESLLPY